MLETGMTGVVAPTLQDLNVSIRITYVYIILFYQYVEGPRNRIARSPQTREAPLPSRTSLCEPIADSYSGSVTAIFVCVKPSLTALFGVSFPLPTPRGCRAVVAWT